MANRGWWQEVISIYSRKNCGRATGGKGLRSPRVCQMVLVNSPTKTSMLLWPSYRENMKSLVLSYVFNSSVFETPYR